MARLGTCEAAISPHFSPLEELVDRRLLNLQAVLHVRIYAGWKPLCPALLGAGLSPLLQAADMNDWVRLGPR